MKGQAGQRDRQVVLMVNAGVTTNAVGERVDDWQTLATVWAKFMPVRDVEKWRADEAGSIITARFQIDWTDEVKSVDSGIRVVITEDGMTRTYEVSGVKEMGYRDGLELTASARSER